MTRFEKQQEGTQRTFTITVRFKPEVKESIKETINRWIETYSTDENDLTTSEFVRMAVWHLCKLPDDPRKP